MMQIVLLHALPFDGRMWDQLTTSLEEPVLAPTLYGLGDSIEEWAAAVLDTVDPGPLIVAGCSVGGSCALEIAPAAPDRVAALVLIGAKAGVRPDPVSRDEALDVLGHGGMAAAWDHYWAPLFGRSTPDAVLDEARRMALAQDPVAVARGVRAFYDRCDLSDVVDTWTRPLVVVSGDQDRTPPSTTTRRLADRPGREFHLVEDCGHYVPLERPGVVDRLIRSVS